MRVWPDRLVTAQIETMALRVLYLVAIRAIRLANIARPWQAFKNAEIMVLRQEVMALPRQVPLRFKCAF